MENKSREACTVKPVLSDHMKQDIFLAFQIDGYLLLHENSAESSYRSFLHYFYSAISNVGAFCTTFMQQ